MDREEEREPFCLMCLAFSPTIPFLVPPLGTLLFLLPPSPFSFTHSTFPSPASPFFHPPWKDSSPHPLLPCIPFCLNLSCQLSCSLCLCAYGWSPHWRLIPGSRSDCQQVLVCSLIPEAGGTTTQETSNPHYRVICEENTRSSTMLRFHDLDETLEAPKVVGVQGTIKARMDGGSMEIKMGFGGKMLLTEGTLTHVHGTCLMHKCRIQVKKSSFFLIYDLQEEIGRDGRGRLPLEEGLANPRRVGFIHRLEDEAIRLVDQIVFGFREVVEFLGLDVETFIALINEAFSLRGLPWFNNLTTNASQPLIEVLLSHMPSLEADDVKDELKKEYYRHLDKPACDA
ncbi:unnamed protein product [Darwinula stevensoni]|uniref:Uncharacterized protein n=1 Tax=Darwinula stevensoni TaxID=69355 RepID=A0A7R8XEF4_9CRUS|nr:unnamed protein product [Darwinula stevensoni]CAG0895732.1 unnamed protein product [Darwinula stevensoni]